MSENEKAGRLPRRQFVKLSGAAAVLAGAGAVAGRTAPATVQDLLCGNDNDSGTRFFLWERAKECGDAFRAKKPTPGSCLATTSTYVVLNGQAPPVTHNFLLVPTRRVKGIECPYLWSSNAPNYWQDAWNQAQRYVKYAATGLGVNPIGNQPGEAYPDAGPVAHSHGRYPPWCAGDAERCESHRCREKLE
jgi:CDP-diacylglycerol pyrophosphatase